MQVEKKLFLRASQLEDAMNSSEGEIALVGSRGNLSVIDSILPVLDDSGFLRVETEHGPVSIHKNRPIYVAEVID